jgi:hypothetical protein
MLAMRRSRGQGCARNRRVELDGLAAAAKMIVKTRHGGNREVRDIFSSINTSPPSWATLSRAPPAGSSP